MEKLLLEYAPPQPPERPWHRLPGVRWALLSSSAALAAFVSFCLQYMGAFRADWLLLGLAVLATAAAVAGLVMGINGFRRCKKPGLAWDFAVMVNGLLTLLGVPFLVGNFFF